MSVLFLTGWDIYVFSHESSETIKNIWFQSVCSVGWLFWAKKTFFLFLIQIGPNHSEMVPNGQKLLDTTFGSFGAVSEWFGPKAEKWGFRQKWPTNRANTLKPDIFSCFTCFVAENIDVPSRYTQNWHRKGETTKKCHETTKITFDSYCETPCRQLRISND